MKRGMPWSVLVHVLGLLAVFFWGNRVSRAVVQPPRAISVRMQFEQPREQPVVREEPVRRRLRWSRRSRRNCRPRRCRGSRRSDPSPNRSPNRWSSSPNRSRSRRRRTRWMTPPDAAEPSLAPERPHGRDGHRFPLRLVPGPGGGTDRAQLAAAATGLPRACQRGLRGPLRHRAQRHRIPGHPERGQRCRGCTTGRPCGR